MLFVHDDGAEPGKRKQYGRAGSNQDNRLAISDFQPGAQAFAVVQGGMPYRNPVAEIAAEAGQGLRCQVDFRHQHQCLLVALQAGFQVVQVQFGFAASGNAV